MHSLDKRHMIFQKRSYEQPVISKLVLSGADIITESHSDSNMGEWDTE